METETIGKAAGIIWSELRDADGGRALSEIKKLGGFSADELVAAIGWLAREGKIDFEVRRKRTYVRLVAAELCV